MQKLVSSAPVPVGIMLYHALADRFTVLLVSDGDPEHLEYWLKLENLSRHALVVYNDSSLEFKSPPLRRLAQVNTLRTRGFAIDMVVEPDPSVCAALLGSGYCIMNFIHSAYALPQWRPDYVAGPKPWDTLQEEIINSQLLRAKDTRLAQLKEDE